MNTLRYASVLLVLFENGRSFITGSFGGAGSLGGAPDIGFHDAGNIRSFGGAGSFFREAGTFREVGTFREAGTFAGAILVGPVGAQHALIRKIYQCIFHHMCTKFLAFPLW